MTTLRVVLAVVLGLVLGALVMLGIPQWTIGPVGSGLLVLAVAAGIGVLLPASMTVRLVVVAALLLVASALAVRGSGSLGPRPEQLAITLRNARVPGLHDVIPAGTWMAVTAADPPSARGRTDASPDQVAAVLQRSGWRSCPVAQDPTWQRAYRWRWWISLSQAPAFDGQGYQVRLFAHHGAPC